MEFSGKTAFVTGAANGIGLGICRALARNGVNIVLADIERGQLQIARRELATFNVRTRAIEVDVSDAAAFERAADEAEAEFGNIHFLFNNAGVSLGAMPLWEVTPAQWEWIFGVNVQGVINGISTLVPRMRKHGETGHVVNTASIGGLQVNPKLRNGSYAMTKYAIVALSEALALDLEGSAIGASVLCPALVATTLHPRRGGARRGWADLTNGQGPTPPRHGNPPDCLPMMSACAFSTPSPPANFSSSRMRSRGRGSSSGTRVSSPDSIPSHAITPASVRRDKLLQDLRSAPRIRALLD